MHANHTHPRVLSTSGQVPNRSYYRPAPCRARVPMFPPLSLWPLSG